MKQGKISQMSVATQTLFLREYRNIGSILVEEAEIRAKLTRLDARLAQNNGAEADNHMMRAIGADLLWQGWTSRTRRQLNIELAQVLARKSAVMDRVRVAFGRQQAVEFLRTANLSDRRKRIANRYSDATPQIR